MWRIRIDKLFSEVGGNIAGAKVTFRTPGAEKEQSGKLTTPGHGYVFTMPGKCGLLEVEHDDRTIVEFEVLEMNDDELPEQEKADETVGTGN